MHAEFVFSEAYDRIVCELGAKNGTDLAQKLGISQPTLYYSIQKQCLPANWLMRLLAKHRLNPDWVLFGDGFKKYLEPVDEKPEL